VTSRLPLKIVAGVLFAAGCGYLAWTLAIGVFSIVYEILLTQAAEAPLDNKTVLEQIRLVAWFLGAVLGALVFWRWHRADPALTSRIKRAIVFGVTAAGATHLGYVLMHGVSVETMVVTAFFSLVAGSVIAAAAYGPLRPVLYFAGRMFGTSVAGVALLMLALAFNKGMSTPYDALGKERLVWVKVAFPQDRSRPGYKDIKVELRTPTQSVKCFAISWETENNRAVLPMRCDFIELTPEREVVLTLPGEAPLVMKMPFARNPKPMYDYSTWISLRDGIAFRYRVT
jgi:hypothetical protein